MPTSRHSRPIDSSQSSTDFNGAPLTPQRAASNALVDNGNQALDQGQHDRAIDLFQEAVSVDPTNGAGYYYLALVKSRTGEYGGAWGYLEKAQSLLLGQAAWAPKLEELRKELSQTRLD